MMYREPDKFVSSVFGHFRSVVHDDSAASMEM